MSYTDEQIEAVVSAYRAAHDRSYQSYRIDSAARKAGCEAARTALEAMEREPVTAEQVAAYCKERGLVVMTRDIAEHLTRQAR